MKKFIILVLPIVLQIYACSPKQNTEEKNKIQREKNIALQLYSLREDIKNDYKGILKKIAIMGYAAVETNEYKDGKFYGFTPQVFKYDIEKEGMIVLSSHVSHQLTDKELKSKDFTESLKWWDQCIDDHIAVGAKYLVFMNMTKPQSLKDLQTYCDYFNQVGKKCQEKGLLFGYHNCADEFTKIEGKTIYDYMLVNTNPEYVFFQMDVYWIARGGESAVEYFKKYPGRFKLLHIKDDKELGQSGMVGFDAIFKNTEIGGVEYLIVEVDKYNYTPLESVKASLDYLLSDPYVKTSYSE